MWKHQFHSDLWRTIFLCSCIVYCVCNMDQVSATEMSGLWNFSVRVQSWSDKIESDQVLSAKFLKIISPIQSWSANVKSCIFILPHEAKELLELFCLSPITIGWRQNTSSIVFASWGKIDTTFRHFRNLTINCLLGIRGKSTAGVILLLGQLFGLVKWQGRYTWISVRSLLHDRKPQTKTWTQNLNPKPKPKTWTKNLNPKPKPKTWT